MHHVHMVPTPAHHCQARTASTQGQAGVPNSVPPGGAGTRLWLLSCQGGHGVSCGSSCPGTLCSGSTIMLQHVTSAGPSAAAATAKAGGPAGRPSPTTPHLVAMGWGSKMRDPHPDPQVLAAKGTRMCLHGAASCASCPSSATVTPTRHLCMGLALGKRGSGAQAEGSARGCCRQHVWCPLPGSWVTLFGRRSRVIYSQRMAEPYKGRRDEGPGCPSLAKSIPRSHFRCPSPPPVPGTWCHGSAQMQAARSDGSLRWGKSALGCTQGGSLTQKAGVPVLFQIASRDGQYPTPSHIPGSALFGQVWAWLCQAGLSRACLCQMMLRSCWALTG